MLCRIKFLMEILLSYIFFYLFADLRTAFDLLDRNRDGRVTANELQFMLKNLGINVRDEIIHDLIREASHSGKWHLHLYKRQQELHFN